MIGICSNPLRDTGLKLTQKLSGMLNSAGYETVICTLFGEKNDVPENVKCCDLKEIAGQVSLLAVIGGDGTILSASKIVHDFDVPILGINLGNKGFMASLEQDELESVLSAAKGDMNISRRMKLDVELKRKGETVYKDCCLNDAVIHGYGDCIRLYVSCGNRFMDSIYGDGIILATPTGSTGYSMSAGGPIMEPECENIIVTPICAHAFGSRSFIMSPDRQICVKVEKHVDRRAYLSIDGTNSFQLENGDELMVKRSSHYALLADMGLRSFFDISREKLR